MFYTRSSADADKPARRVWRSVKVTKHSTIPYVRLSFLLCSSNFVFKTRRFHDIRLQKSRDLEMGSKVTQGHWEWYHSTVYRFLLVFFSNFVPKMHCFWDIRLQKCCDLENRVRGPSRSWKCHHVIEHIWLPIYVL